MEQERNKLKGCNIKERGRKIKIAAEMGLVDSSRGRHWSRALRRGLVRNKARCCKMVENNTCEAKVEEEEEEEGGEEVVEIERRVRVLQRLIPGGEAFGIERLFEETADYIEALEGQVTAMRALATFLDGLDKERRVRVVDG